MPNVKRSCMICCYHPRPDLTMREDESRCSSQSVHAAGVGGWPRGPLKGRVKISGLRGGFVNDYHTTSRQYVPYPKFCCVRTTNNHQSEPDDLLSRDVVWLTTQTGDRAVLQHGSSAIWWRRNQSSKISPKILSGELLLHAVPASARTTWPAVQSIVTAPSGRLRLLEAERLRLRFSPRRPVAGIDLDKMKTTSTASCGRCRRGCTRRGPALLARHPRRRPCPIDDQQSAEQSDGVCERLGARATGNPLLLLRPGPVSAAECADGRRCGRHSSLGRVHVSFPPTQLPLSALRRGLGAMERWPRKSRRVARAPGSARAPMSAIARPRGFSSGPDGR